VGVLSGSEVGGRGVVSTLFVIVVGVVVLFVVVVGVGRTSGAGVGVRRTSGAGVGVGRRSGARVGVGRTSGAGVGEREEDLEEEELFGRGLVLGVELVIFVGFFFGFVLESVSILSALA